MLLDHLILIPVIIVAAIVYLVTSRYDLKIFMKVSKIVLIISVILFIYKFAAYKGYDMIEYLKNFIANVMILFQ